MKKHLAMLLVTAFAVTTFARGAFAGPFADVPFDHWAYEALKTLSDKGIVEGYPDGTFRGQQTMTRYEFAVAVARAMDKGGSGRDGKDGRDGAQGAAGANGTNGTTGAKGDKGDTGAKGDQGLQGLPGKDAAPSDAKIREALDALKKEFGPELAKIGKLEQRVSALEENAKTPKTGNITFSGSLEAQQSLSSYVNAGATGAGPTAAEDLDIPDDRAGLLHTKIGISGVVNDNVTTKVELWNVEGGATGIAGPVGIAPATTGTVLVREANANFDVTNWGHLTVGRQHVAYGEGLTVNNDLATMDLLNWKYPLGPKANFNLVWGDTDTGAAGNSYNFGGGGVNFITAGTATPGVLIRAPYGATGAKATAVANGADLASGNDEYFSLRLDGVIGAVKGGITWLGDGVDYEQAWGVDVNFDVWSRNVGIEYSKSSQYFNGTSSTGSDDAWYVRADLWKTPKFKLWAGYGDAAAGYQPPTASVWNPYARTAGEQLFDRPNGNPLGTPIPVGGPGATALGAVANALIGGNLPMMSSVWTLGFTYDLPKWPLSFQWTQGDAPDNLINVAGLPLQAMSLGDLWQIGVSHAITDGVDIELKYGQVSPDANAALGAAPDFKYFRIGTKLSF